jgi:endonuclease YncB( thermonuclease family)
LKTQSLIWSCVVVGLVSAAAGFGAAPPELSGLCLSVESGDTIIVATDDGKIRVRLAGARAPVDGQPFAERSLVAVVESTYAREVRLVVVSVDPGGTLLADVMNGDVNLAERQLASGLAWADPEHANYPQFATIEADARGAGLGLWSQSSPESPWDFVRRREAARSASVATPTPSLAELAAGTRIEQGRDRHITMVGSPSPTPTQEIGVLAREALIKLLADTLEAEAGSPKSDDTAAEADTDAP